MPDELKKYKKYLNNWYKVRKENNKCRMCGKTKYLQYHHVDPSTKVETIAHMVHDAWPKEDIVKEMAKCIVLCRSCHCKTHNKMKKKKRFN